jgi:hypothetical protein
MVYESNCVKENNTMKRMMIAMIAVATMTSLMAGDAKLSGDTHFYYGFEDADNNSFHVSRAYLTFEKKVSDALSYKFQTDVGSGGATDFTVYLKNAKLDWKTDFGKFSFGLQGMNMFKVQEDNWGYRFIEKSAMDKAKYSSSADMGIGFSKKLAGLSTGLMITNGSGYKKAETDGYKKLSANVLYGEAKLKKGINAGVAFSYEPKDYTLSDGSGDETGSKTVIGGFGAWAQGAIKVGAETAVLTKSMEASTSTNLISAYGNYAISKKLDAFGRFDLYSSDAAADSYAIIGVNYVPEKGLHIAPTVLVDMPDGGDTSMTYRINFRFKI